MKKWIALFRITLVQSLEYRAETFLWILLDIFPTVILTILWTTLFKNTSVIGGHSLSQLLVYYMSILVIINIAEVHFEERWVESIRRGKIDFNFLKPLSLPTQIFVETLAKKVISFLLFLFPFSLFLLVLHSVGVITTLEFSGEKTLLFFVFLILAFFFNTLLSFFVVLAAFWMDEAGSIGHFKWMMTGIFGGTMAPLQFYPESIQRIAAVLPFRRALSTPASLFSTPTVTPYFVHEVVIFFLYVCALFVIARWVWKKAVYTYTSTGG
ncbi:MAG: ABC-2 family transporter protein [Candidatus Pacebacteria bacterium]|nr:ABC-2 family transporter protein [Candidatus Paceibacterota bacterium]